MKAKRATITCITLALGLASAPSGADAQTLYKLIDKNGKVTYSEKPPKDYDGKVIRLDIDPNANTATLPKPPPPPAPEVKEGSARPAPAREPSRADRVAVAQARLESARKAFIDARDNPKEGDINWIGNVGGGARQVPSESYARRLVDLEASVKEAEENLRRVEQGG